MTSNHRIKCESCGELTPLPKSLEKLLEDRAVRYVQLLDENTALRAQAERAEAENAELEQVFELQHSRSMEAVALWRAAHPGNELVMPDLGTLWTWVLSALQHERERVATLEQDAARLEALISWARNITRPSAAGDPPQPLEWLCSREAIDAALARAAEKDKP